MGLRDGLMVKCGEWLKLGRKVGRGWKMAGN